MKIKTGLILCGGAGRRVRNYINSKQKCMHRVFGIPVITYLLDQLNISGFRNIYFLCYYNHREISDYFGKKFKNLNLNYIIEKEKLGTGGAIINCFKRTKISKFSTCASEENHTHMMLFVCIRMHSICVC